MVMMRSSSGIKPERTFNKVVLPEPVPPETITFNLATTHAFNNSIASAVILPNSTNRSTVSGILKNLRIVSTGPTREIGGITAFTREPSGKRAST